MDLETVARVMQSLQVRAHLEVDELIPDPTETEYDAQLKSAPFQFLVGINPLFNYPMVGDSLSLPEELTSVYLTFAKHGVRGGVNTFGMHRMRKYADEQFDLLKKDIIDPEALILFEYHAMTPEFCHKDYLTAPSPVAYLMLDRIVRSRPGAVVSLSDTPKGLHALLMTQPAPIAAKGDVESIGTVLAADLLSGADSEVRKFPFYERRFHSYDILSGTLGEPKY